MLKDVKVLVQQLRVWRFINSTNKSIDDLLIKEVNKRKNEIESGNIKLVDGDQVF